MKTSCDSCGSSDGKELYDDGHSYCFVCGDFSGTKHRKEGGFVEQTPKEPKPIPYPKFQIRAINTRGITLETCQKFNYGCVQTGVGKWLLLSNHYNTKFELIGQKVRDPNPVNPKKKILGSYGNINNLYGQWLFTPDKKSKVIITEGEEDAMAAYQMLNHQGNLAFLSITKGALSAFGQLLEHQDYLRGFREILLMFDNDKPGQDSARECIDSGLADRIIHIPFGKDACDTLVEINKHVTVTNTTVSSGDSE